MTDIERRSAAKVDAWRADHPNTPVTSIHCLRCPGEARSYVHPGLCFACAAAARQAPKDDASAFLRDLSAYREQWAEFEAATATESFVTMLDKMWKVGQP